MTPEEEKAAANKQYIQELEKYADHLRKAKEYSVQRIDLLIISISGAGVYTCTEILKYIDGSKLLSSYEKIIGNPFEIAGTLFILTIVLNFISQWSAYKGSNLALEATKKDIYYRKEETEEEEENIKIIAKLEKIGKRLNEITKIMNNASVILLITSLVILLCSFFHLF
jgi:hypothetical protein